MPAVVRLLLQRNAMLDIVDKYGDTARDHATDVRTLSCFETGSTALLHTDYRTGDKKGMPSTFPHELLLCVVRFLDPKSVSRAACVAGKWHRGNHQLTYCTVLVFVAVKFIFLYMNDNIPLVCESAEIWSALGIRRWEKVLQSSLGFGPSPAAVFRPGRKLGVLSAGGGTVCKTVKNRGMIASSDDLQGDDHTLTTTTTS